ncbi:F-box protein [Legionella hackeliae]|nr:F-box protein [Legionella hackeliae]
MSITELPEEIILMCLSYLSIEELAKMLVVSKFFLFFAEDNGLWKRFVSPSSTELGGTAKPGFFKTKFKEQVNSLLPILRSKVISRELSYLDAEKITARVNNALAFKEISIGFFQDHNGDVVRGIFSKTLQEFTINTYIFSDHEDKGIKEKTLSMYLFATNSSRPLEELCKSYPGNLIFVVTNDSRLVKITANYPELIKYYITDTPINETISICSIHPLVIDDLKIWQKQIPSLLQRVELSKQELGFLTTSNKEFEDYNPLGL